MQIKFRFFQFSCFNTLQGRPPRRPWLWVMATSASGGVLAHDAAMAIRIPAGLPIPFDRAEPVWYT